MKARTFFIGAALALALAGGFAYMQGIRSVDDAVAASRKVGPLNSAIAWAEGFWTPRKATAQAPQERSAQPTRVVPVEVTPAVRKKTPVVLHALGTVTPIASVAIKSRLDTSIVKVEFADGAEVKKGDVLFSLDSRQIEAQIAQVQGMLARDRAQLEGAERDVKRYTDLVGKGATPITNLDNAKTQASVFKAAITADQGQLDNLQVQLSYCTIRAPITGRISAANVKVGNFVRSADSTPLATINQMAPVYVSFTVPQKDLPDVRHALANQTATVNVTVPGETKQASGRVTMIENTVDPSTGMVMVRATMPNEDEILWPGTLVTAELILRVEDAVTVPSVAVQSGQQGTYVMIIKNDLAEVRPVTVERTFGQDSVIAKGVEPGEQVVTNGQLLLANGVKVRVRQRKAGA